MRRIVIALVLYWAAAGASALEPPHWDYEGDAGPEHWDQVWPACAGNAQSPVDIAAPVDVDLPPIEFEYAAVGASLVNNGHTLQADLADGNAIRIAGDAFALKQFHFHAPAENRVAGVEHPLELHLVHADANGRLAVVAVLFAAGDEHPALARLWPQLPATAGMRTPLAEPLVAQALLPAARDYYRYDGSLTTPPCTEGVRWLVMKQVQAASAAQIERFVHLLPHANNRPLQPLNARTVQE